MFGFLGLKSGLSFTTGLFLLALAVVLVILIPNIDNISEKFGFDTKSSLRAKNATQATQIDQITDANTNLAAGIKTEAAISDAKDTAVNDNVTDGKTIDAKQRTIDTKRNTVIRTVTTDKTKQQAQAEQEVSLAQITSVWENYCIFNDNPQCTAIEQGVKS